jgi:hypothetical protein
MVNVAETIERSGGGCFVQPVDEPILIDSPETVAAGEAATAGDLEDAREILVSNRNIHNLQELRVKSSMGRRSCEDIYITRTNKPNQIRPPAPGSAKSLDRDARDSVPVYLLRPPLVAL